MCVQLVLLLLVHGLKSPAACELRISSSRTHLATTSQRGLCTPAEQAWKKSSDSIRSTTPLRFATAICTIVLDHLESFQQQLVPDHATALQQSLKASSQGSNSRPTFAATWNHSRSTQQSDFPFLDPFPSLGPPSQRQRNIFCDDLTTPRLRSNHHRLDYRLFFANVEQKRPF